MKSKLAACALAALCALPLHAATDVTGPQGLLKGQVPDELQSLKRIAITNFSVLYVNELGIGSKRKSSEVFFSLWKGPSPEVLQATADALYAQLVADLKAAGIDVVAPEEVAAQPALAEMRKAAKPNPFTFSDATLMKGGILVAAQNLPLIQATVQDVKLDSYATKPVENTDRPGNLIGWDRQAREWLPGSGAEVFSLASIYTGQARVSAALNATVLNVRLTVPLVDLGVTTCGNTSGSCAGWSNITGVIKPNPRIVEAGTVFTFTRSDGNPGHVHALGLQKPVPIAGLKVTAEPERLELKTSFLGPDTRTARSGGLVGLFARGAGADSEKADFWVSFDPAELQPALVGASAGIFKELAQILAAGK